MPVRINLTNQFWFIQRGDIIYADDVASTGQEIRFGQRGQEERENGANRRWMRDGRGYRLRRVDGEVNLDRIIRRSYVLSDE